MSETKHLPALGTANVGYSELVKSSLPAYQLGASYTSFAQNPVMQIKVPVLDVPAETKTCVHVYEGAPVDRLLARALATMEKASRDPVLMDRILKRANIIDDNGAPIHHEMAGYTN